MSKKHLKFLHEGGLIGCDASYEDAEFVVFGAPYDGTTSFRPGTRFAPAAYRNDFEGLELYSPYQDKSLEDCKIHDAGDLEFSFGDPKPVLETLEKFTDELVNDGKKPVMLGGEHSLSFGTVSALAKKYPDLHIIHFDAHTDLREDYLGERFSHASVMKRCYDLLGPQRLYQFGIRSGEAIEFYFAKKRNHFHPLNLDGLDLAVKELKEKNVPIYLSVDLDVLDPSVFPGTGTPEPGGVSFQELHKALLSLKGLNIVGFDLMELSPPYDLSGISTAVACKLLRECLIAYSS